MLFGICGDVDVEEASLSFEVGRASGRDCRGTGRVSCCCVLRDVCSPVEALPPVSQDGLRPWPPRNLLSVSFADDICLWVWCLPV